MLQARDADAYDRILLLTDSAWGSPGPPSPRLRAVAAAIPEMWPDARITMLLGTAEAGDQLTGPLLEAGIEVAAEKDWDAWFEARRFHYSTVIVPGAACFERFDPLIAATQPQATRVHAQVMVGASPRGSLALLLLARARAVLSGRDYVVPEDVKAVAEPALAHRISLRPEMWLRRVDPGYVVREVLESTPAPASGALPSYGYADGAARARYAPQR